MNAAIVKSYETYVKQVLMFTVLEITEDILLIEKR